MIEEIAAGMAAQLFAKLPAERRIATLSPGYVIADAARDASLRPRFVLYRDKRGFWLHGFHQSAIDGTDRSDIQSPYGYGGPVSNCDEEAFRQDAWNAYCNWCITQKIVVEFVRLHPLAPWQNYSGQQVEDRETVCVDLTVEDLRATYEVRCRTAVRKAEKAAATVEIHPVTKITAQFASFYKEGMQRIGATDYYIFGDAYFSGLAQLPEIKLFVCERDNIWLAAGLFLAGGDCLEYHLSAVTELGRSFSATNLLIDAAASWGTQQGLKKLYLGGGTNRQKDNALLKFKEGFSPLKQTFSYGYAVHDPMWYEDARAKFPASEGRILFYR